MVHWQYRSAQLPDVTIGNSLSVLRTIPTMMAIHTLNINELLRHGLVVPEERQPVRLVLSSDHEAQCTLAGHEGPNGTMPCNQGKTRSSPTKAHATLDAKNRTLHVVLRPWHLRHADQYAIWSTPRARSAQEDHLSVTWRTLLSPHPRQIVPKLRHITLGINLWMLRLGVEVLLIPERLSWGQR